MTPLEIALQEYTYWRDCDDPASGDETLGPILIGATAAAANIAARLAGAEGFRYRELSDQEIKRALTEIRLAHRMAAVIEVLYEHLNARLDQAPPNAVPVYEGIADLHSIVQQLKKGSAA